MTETKQGTCEKCGRTDTKIVGVNKEDFISKDSTDIVRFICTEHCLRG